jgi:hypothetical protein
MFRTIAADHVSFVPSSFTTRIPVRNLPIVAPAMPSSNTKYRITIRLGQNRRRPCQSICR